MYTAELIFSHFPDLTEKQREQIERLKPLYEDWNAKINVISRKDMDAFYLKHVLHNILQKHLQLLPGQVVLDVGTGCGFPGVPLAILFPKTEFHWWILLEEDSGRRGSCRSIAVRKCRGNSCSCRTIEVSIRLCNF